MKDEFTNRLGAFRTTLDFLNQPANKLIWQGQPPARFGSLVTQASAAVDALAAFCQEQSAVITGAAQDKKREEEELEIAAHRLGQAVAECCNGVGNHADAARCDFTLSKWRQMRDAHLLANAREVVRIARALLAGPHAAEAGECGITTVSVDTCENEANDYAALIAAPQQAIANRKGHTTLLRDRFNEVEAIFDRLDSLVIQFPTPAFIAGYRAARTIRDLGRGPGNGEEPAPPSAI